MTPPNGKFKVVSFVEDAASITVPEGTTHMVFAANNSHTHTHVKVDGVELVVQPGLPIALNCTTISNAVIGTSFTGVTFLRIQP
jgi:hypothetical protein